VEMAWTPEGCLFRYEASQDGLGNIVSVPHEIPFVTSSLTQAQNDCATRGLLVATLDQLQLGCEGVQGWSYPYGNSYTPGMCNDSEGGYGGLAPTGTFEDCVSPFGIHDPTGNYWDFAMTPTGWIYLGGSTNTFRPTCAETGYENQIAQGALRCAEPVTASVTSVSVSTQIYGPVLSTP